MTDETRPQLINDMPELLHDLVAALETHPGQWSATSSRSHARHRIKLGVDIGGLSEEIGIVGETVLQLASEKDVVFTNSEIAAMFRVLARGAAEAVTEYSKQRDSQLSRESARHFSFIAHELRTPLQTAQLAVNLLQRQEEAVVAKLQRAHQQLLELVDNALIHARLISEPEVNKEVVASRELVDQTMINSVDFAEQRGVEVRASSGDFELEVDRRLIVSALTNLVINGVKFSKPGTKVELCAHVQDERVHFEVADSCGGLPEGAQVSMFRPFVQSGADRSGFGLGLMIVKQAVDAHGGSIRVLNRGGQGCKFIVELPRLRSRLSQPDNQPSRD